MLLAFCAGIEQLAQGAASVTTWAAPPGETLCVAGGAVVDAAVEARGASGVGILGRGVIDTSDYERYVENPNHE